MKTKKLIIALVALVIPVSLIIWTRPNHFLDDIKSENIHAISVRDGSTGKDFEITGQEDITFIVEKIQAQSFKKDGLSIFNMGTLYTMHFYDADKKLIAKFILNSNDTLRKDPFFYKATSTMSGLIEYFSTIK